MAAFVVTGIIGVVALAIFLVTNSSETGRFVGAIALAGIALFCGFGFLHRFEAPGVDAWKICYSLTGVVSLIGSGWLLWSKQVPD